MGKEKDQQATLFDVEKERRERKPHSRIRRSKQGNMTAYHLCLRLAKTRIDYNQPINLKDIQTMCNIGKFPASLLPNLKDINADDITLEYTINWYNSDIAPYYKEKNAKQKAKSDAETVEAVEVVEVIEPHGDPRPLKEIVAELKAELIATIDKKLASMMAF